jgi:putative transcriptional regulator
MNASDSSDDANASAALTGASTPSALTQSLTGQFLIAMPGLTDPNFSQTVTYLFKHDDEGAMGIVINRPLKMLLSEVFGQLKVACENPRLGQQFVLLGGPVQPEQGFVIHPPGGNWEYSVPVSQHIHITTSRDILAALANGTGPDSALVALGYAGWGSGQLEEEISRNSWLTVAADARVLFNLPYTDRWRAAANLLGVDFNKMSPDAGRA